MGGEDGEGRKERGREKIERKGKREREGSSLTMVTANRPTPAATGSARSTGTMVRSVDQCPCTFPSEGLPTFSLF